MQLKQEYFKLKADQSNLEELKQILSNKRVWLVDVFDTVLSRRLYEANVSYHEVFSQIEYYLPKDVLKRLGSYKTARIEAGHKARENNPLHTLEDIARELPIQYYAIPFFESFIDKQMLVASKFGQWLITYAAMSQNKDKVKYFLSDVYYQSEDVAQFLYKAYSPELLEPWVLLCSATDRIAKYDGTMYDKVLEDLHAKGEECIMISDRVEDLEKAKYYQIEGVLIDPQIRGI